VQHKRRRQGATQGFEGSPSSPSILPRLVINLKQNILAYGAVVAFFVLTFYIISKGLGTMEAEESFIIGNLTGMAAAIAKDIYGYYFGSSKGELEARGSIGRRGAQKW
jgi:hypothetical protein